MPMTIRVKVERGEIVVDIRTRGPDGKKVRERRNAPAPIRTEAAAQKWAEARARHLNMHGKQALAVEMPTLAAFTARWMEDFAKANGNKPSTIATKERISRLHLLPVLGALALDAIGEAEAQKVRVHLRAHGAESNTTHACVLSQLATILGAAERWLVIDRAPHIEIPRRDESEMTFHDFEEWERIVSGAFVAGPMVYAMVLLAGEAGLRRGELVALELADVGPQEITIRHNEWEGKVGTPKGGKIRRVPMTERLRVAIAKVRHLRGKRLLWQPNGRKVVVPTLQSWLELACRRAALPESRNIHKLRHTFCSHLVMRGATLKAVQELAGHVDIATTMRYAHLSPSHKAEAIKLLEHRVRGAGGEQESK